MKICLFTSTFFPTTGGTENAVHYLAKHFTEMGHEVVVLTPIQKILRNISFKANYKIHRYPSLPQQLFLTGTEQLALLYEKFRFNFDILNIHKAYGAYSACRIKDMLKVPIVVTCRGGDIQKMPEIGYGRRLDPVWDTKIRYALKNVDALTAIAPSTRQDLLEIGVDGNRIVDIPNGAELSKFGTREKDIREILMIPKGVKIILSVGRYHIKKGYKYLIQAMAHVVKEYQNVRCLIMGKGLERLESLIDEHNLKKYIVLVKEQSFRNSKVIDLAKVPNDTLLSAYTSSDIYVSSSLIEGFALVAVEAMAAGLPIVATNVPGNKDAVKDGENGLLVESKDAKQMANKIICLLRDEELRRKLSKMSKNMAQQYDWRLIAQRYLDVYTKVIDKTKF